MEGHQTSEAFGLKQGDRGAHTSRTMMLTELQTLFMVSRSGTGREDLRRLVLDDNVLGKQTGSNRRLTFQRLSELYGLDPLVPIFRVLRVLWNDLQGQPLLAFLCAAARDPLLRMTTSVILETSAGQIVTKLDFEDVLRREAAGRLNESVTAKVARNAASSWTQSGHLSGRVKKIRSRAVATPHTVSFALLLGRIEGRHGAALFDSDWIRLQDASPQEVHGLARRASASGLIRYKAIGDVVEVDFDGLLTREEIAKLP